MLPDAKVPEDLIYKAETGAIPLWLKASLAGAAMLGLVATLVALWIARLNRRLNSEIIERREAEREIQRANAQAESARQQLVAMSEPCRWQCSRSSSYQALTCAIISSARSRADPRRAGEGADGRAALRWRHVHPDDAEVVRSILADATTGSGGRVQR